MTTLSSTFTLHNLTLPLLNYTLLHTTALLYETSPHLTIALLHFNPPHITLPLLYFTSPHKTRPLLYIVLYSALLYCTTPHLTLPLLDRASYHSTLPLLNYTLHNAIPYLPDSTSPYSAVALHHLTKPHRTLHSIALPLLNNITRYTTLQYCYFTNSTSPYRCFTKPCPTLPNNYITSLHITTPLLDSTSLCNTLKLHLMVLNQT